eukprot:gene744-392_t
MYNHEKEIKTTTTTEKLSSPSASRCCVKPSGGPCCIDTIILLLQLSRIPVTFSKNNNKKANRKWNRVHIDLPDFFLIIVVFLSLSLSGLSIFLTDHITTEPRVGNLQSSTRGIFRKQTNWCTQ